MNIFKICTLVLIGFIAPSISLGQDDLSSDSENLVQNLGNNFSTTTLKGLLYLANLSGTLQGEGPFTVFAPVNSAFTSLPESTLKVLSRPEKQKDLQAILLNHVVAGNVESKKLKDGDLLKTLGGEILKVKIRGDKLFVNNSLILSADNEASNGFFHLVNSAILPPLGSKATFVSGVSLPATNTIGQNIALPSNLSTLFKGLEKSGLKTELDGDEFYTVFAPNNTAFKEFPSNVLSSLMESSDPSDLKAILNYHILKSDVRIEELNDGDKLLTLSGKKVKVTKKNGVLTIGGASVETYNIKSKNGFIHVIDKVIIL
jgi:transforming growth factor-beta-induced protein